jgi:hypothetical protein
MSAEIKVICDPCFDFNRLLPTYFFTKQYAAVSTMAASSTP